MINFINQKIIVVNENAFEEFSAMHKEDYFYLHHGNDKSKIHSGIKLIGKIISDVVRIYYSSKTLYFQRHYEVIFPVDGIPLSNKLYSDKKYLFAPNEERMPSVYEIPQVQAINFEKNILRPFFGIGIKDLPGLWTSETQPLVKKNETPAPPPIPQPPLKIFPLNQILHGVPGTGKTYSTISYAVAICNNEKLNANENYAKIKWFYHKLIADGRINFVTFHQSYGYEDFIEGIKPTVANGNISYTVASGVFKKFCETAKKLPTENFVFIIDEINRGNISKIFGELITLIAEDKRGEISVTLPYSQENFTVPKNVYIIGTMNTADRLIALMDTALRRRFNFIEMMPRPELLSENIDGVNLKELLTKLNAQIEINYDRDHTIGHAYFINCKTLDDVAEVLTNKIIPLLQEYFFEDYETIYNILGGKFITREPLSDEKFRYTINKDAFKDAESYKQWINS